MFDGEGWRWVEATWTNQLHEPAVGGHRRQPPRHHRPEAGGRVRAGRDAGLRAHPLRRPGAGDAHRHPRGGRGLRTGRRRFHPLVRPRRGHVGVRRRALAAGRLRAGGGRAHHPRGGRGRVPRDRSPSDTRHRARRRATGRRGPVRRARPARTLVDAHPHPRRQRLPRGLLASSCARCASPNRSSSRCSSGPATSSRSRSTATRAPRSSVTSRCTTRSPGSPTVRSCRTGSSTRSPASPTATTTPWSRCSSSTSTASSS